MLNSGLRLYSKLPSDSAINTAPYLVYNYGFENNEWKDELSFHDSSVVLSGKYSALIKPSNEYGPTLVVKLSDIPVFAGGRIEVSAAFESDSVPCNSQLILSIDDKEKNVAWKGEPVNRFLSGARQWGKVYLVVDVPATLSGDEIMNIYCWNEKRESIRMDDVKITYYGSRP